MYTWLLTAPRKMGQIPEGYMIQVITSSTGEPNRKEVEDALRRVGFTDTLSLSYASVGNWKARKM